MERCAKEPALESPLPFCCKTARVMVKPMLNGTLGGGAAMDRLILLLLAAAMFANGLAAIGLLVWAIFLFLVDAEIWGIPFVGSCLCLVLAAWAHTAFDDRIARATVLRQNAKPYERNQQP
jgi:hypothetical protein